MAEIPLKMPKMGESVAEATIINWLKKPGDAIKEEEPIIEIATDKVDSEIPAPCDGIIKKIIFDINDVVPVGEVIAIIDTKKAVVANHEHEKTASTEKEVSKKKAPHIDNPEIVSIPKERFYSPLVHSIARKEKVSIEELNQIQGSGAGGRVRKSDVFSYLKTRNTEVSTIPSPSRITAAYQPSVAFTEGKDRIIEMDRMRQMIADHMVFSKQTSPHVTSYIEVDVTDIVDWRTTIKDDVLKKYGEKITFTPIFVYAVSKAIKDFPMINVSVDGKKIIVHKDIHIGIATALPTGNLIVPVVKNADHKNLIGLVSAINALTRKARENKLNPDEIGGSTFTVSNVGTFGSIMGTPIINQPEVAILATGSIKKRPEVIETPKGDVIAIRQMMYLSLSFDHRVVDGYLGGSFLRKIGDYLENFNVSQRF